ncbi:MAG: sugar ABC transporter substrate-binding protein [Bacillota bacterium]
MHRRWIRLLLALLLLLSGCVQQQPAPTAAKDRIRIGFAMDALQEERWQRDRDIFVARARELGAEVTVQAASGDRYLQLAQMENMLNRGVNVLVVVAHDAKAIGPMVERAHARGVKVIAYDRLAQYADVDFYLAFDSHRVGQLQAEYLTRLVPDGRYLYLGGAPDDENAHLVWRGVHYVLDPLVESGKVHLVSDEPSTGSDPAEIQRTVEEILRRAGGQVDAIAAANDGVAAAAIAALQSLGLAGKVQVVGANAELAALRRIRSGTQAMTVYKPIRLLAEKAADVAVALARGEQPVSTHTVSNGQKEVPAILFEPVAVDDTNWMTTVVRDGFLREEEILGIK